LAPFPTFSDLSAPFPYISIREENPSQNPSLKNNRKHIEQKNCGGVLIFEVEIIHKIMVRERMGVSDLTDEILHKLMVQEGP